MLWNMNACLMKHVCSESRRRWFYEVWRGPAWGSRRIWILHFTCCIRLISVIVLGCQSSLSTCTSVVGRGLGMFFRCEQVILRIFYLTWVSDHYSGYVKFDTESVHIICGWIGWHLDMVVSTISVIYLHTWLMGSWLLKPITHTCIRLCYPSNKNYVYTYIFHGGR